MSYQKPIQRIAIVGTGVPPNFLLAGSMSSPRTPHRRQKLVCGSTLTRHGRT